MKKIPLDNNIKYSYNHFMNHMEYKMLRKFLTILTIAGFLSACGQTYKDKETGKEYDTYGLLNESDMHNHNIQYKISYGNIFWSIVLIETIVAPIYFIGFSLYYPVGKKECFEPGVINQHCENNGNKNG